MSEVCEQASHAAIIRFQPWKIREWNRLVEREFRVKRLRLHAAFMRLPLGNK